MEKQKSNDIKEPVFGGRAKARRQGDHIEETSRHRRRVRKTRERSFAGKDVHEEPE